MASGVVAAAMPALSSLQCTGLCTSRSLRQTRHGYSTSSSIRPTPIRCVVNAKNTNEKVSERSQELCGTVNRREAMGLCGLAATLSLLPCSDRTAAANAAGLPEEEKPRICDADCEKDLDKIPTETTPSGLQYKDIIVGKGPNPVKGFQVAANYVAMIPTGKVFDSSLDKGLPYIFRVGSGQILQGLDEGIMTMKVGGVRRLYIPGELAFPKGLNASAGRPRVPPASPVIFDVNLLYIPGLEDELPGEESEAP
ncbi:unnamed protein product [Calypogeia fissa]